jgi:radical SAM superfamily enzyme YgiQ (UPF0313 family)
MELWHNQVTRVQGPFSLRMFNRSWGLMLIQANITAPCVLLDFPSLERFTAELRDHSYDIIGITSIPPNVLKVKEMCRLIRHHQPQATIVVGGHVANIPDLRTMLDADWIVRGEGVHWFRTFLGEETARPVHHPRISTCIGTRSMGSQGGNHMIEPTATLIPSVGCPMGCNFCATSAMFGGKGQFISFYERGDELFDIMSQLEEELKVQAFFIMDENFLLYRARALRLLELMEQQDKSWSLHVFSSARVLRSYTIDQLIRLGLSWVWLGLEGENSGYSKLDQIDTFELVRELRSHGVRVLGSTIIGLEQHSPDNIDEVIDWAVRHDSDFHQFMLYSPSPGTPFFHEMDERGLLKRDDEFPWADWHGQLAFSWRHPRITQGQETEYILRAFHQDFDVNGPSVLRGVRTLLEGWKRYKSHPDLRVRRRFRRETRGLAKSGVAAVAAGREYYRERPAQYARLTTLLDELCEEFGPQARQIAEVAGPVLLEQLRAEEKRLAEGWTYEPPTFYEINAVGRDRFAEEFIDAELAMAVAPRSTSTHES